MRNHQLTIIEIAAREDGGHGLQSQSGRTECWMEGWIAVPEEMSDAIWTTNGYCDLDIREGVLVGFTPRERPEPTPTAEEQITALKGALSATDYQVIKCGEYQLAGMEPPYDAAALHARRQALRDRINELEGEDDGSAAESM